MPRKKKATSIDSEAPQELFEGQHGDALLGVTYLCVSDGEKMATCAPQSESPRQNATQPTESTPVPPSGSHVNQLVGSVVPDSYALLSHQCPPETEGAVERVRSEARESESLHASEAPVSSTPGTHDGDEVIDAPSSFLLYVDNESLNSFLINQIIAPADFFKPGEVPSRSILRVIGESLLLIPSSNPVRSTELRQYANDSGSSYVVAVELPISAICEMRGRVLTKDGMLSGARSPSQMLGTDIAFICDPWCSVSFSEILRVLFQDAEHKRAVPLISPNLSFDQSRGVVDATAFAGNSELTFADCCRRVEERDGLAGPMSESTKTELSVLPRTRGFLLAALTTSAMTLKSSGRVNLDRAMLEVIAVSTGHTVRESATAWEQFRDAALRHFSISSESVSLNDFDSQDSTPFRVAGAVLSMLGHEPQDSSKQRPRGIAKEHIDDPSETALAATMRYLATSSPAALDDRAAFWALLKQALAASSRGGGTNQEPGAERTIASYQEGVEYLQQVQSGRAKISAERLTSLPVLRALWPVAGSPTVNEFEAKLSSLRLNPGESRLAWSFFGLVHGIGALPARFKKRDDVLLIDRIVHQMKGARVLTGAPARFAEDCSKPLNLSTSRDTAFLYQAPTGLLADFGIYLHVQDYDTHTSMLNALTSAASDQRLQRLLTQRLLPSDLRGCFAHAKEPIEILAHACRELSVVANTDRTVVTLLQMPTSIDITLHGIRAEYGCTHQHEGFCVIVAYGSLSFNRQQALLRLGDVRSMTEGESYGPPERVAWADWNGYKTTLLSSFESWRSHGLTEEDLHSLVSTNVTDLAKPLSHQSRHPATSSSAQTQRGT
jgi:hypothetical protein